MLKATSGLGGAGSRPSADWVPTALAVVSPRKKKVGDGGRADSVEDFNRPSMTNAQRPTCKLSNLSRVNASCLMNYARFGWRALP